MSLQCRLVAFFKLFTIKNIYTLLYWNLCWFRSLCMQVNLSKWIKVPNFHETLKVWIFLFRDQIFIRSILKSSLWLFCKALQPHWNTKTKAKWAFFPCSSLVSRSSWHVTLPLVLCRIYTVDEQSLPCGILHPSSLAAGLQLLDIPIKDSVSLSLLEWCQSLRYRIILLQICSR